MADPTRSNDLEAWFDAQPGRALLATRFAGMWRARLRFPGGEYVGEGRSLHDAIEAAQDDRYTCACGDVWPWHAAELVGVQEDPEEPSELRNCPTCGSTRGRVIAAERAA